MGISTVRNVESGLMRKLSILQQQRQQVSRPASPRSGEGRLSACGAIQLVGVESMNEREGDSTVCAIKSNRWTRT